MRRGCQFQPCSCSSAAPGCWPGSLANTTKMRRGQKFQLNSTPAPPTMSLLGYGFLWLAGSTSPDPRGCSQHACVSAFFHQPRHAWCVHSSQPGALSSSTAFRNLASATHAPGSAPSASSANRSSCHHRSLWPPLAPTVKSTTKLAIIRAHCRHATVVLTESLAICVFVLRTCQDVAPARALLPTHRTNLLQERVPVFESHSNSLEQISATC